MAENRFIAVVRRGMGLAVVINLDFELRKESFQHPDPLKNVL